MRWTGTSFWCVKQNERCCATGLTTFSRQPKLPGEPGYKDEFQIWLQATITSSVREPTEDGIIHSRSEVLPSSRAGPVKWRMGHLQNRDGDLQKPWLEDPLSPFPCPGYGFGKPTINTSDNDFPCSIAYLMGDIDLPARMTPSFELTDPDGEIRLQYEMVMTYSPEGYKFENLRSIEIRVPVLATSGRQPPPNAAALDIDDTAPPSYSE